MLMRWHQKKINWIRNFASNTFLILCSQIVARLLHAALKVDAFRRMLLKEALPGRRILNLALSYTLEAFDDSH